MTVPATPEQIQRIHDGMPPRYAMSILLTVYCGSLRIGEVCGLQRGDIDLERGTLSVRRARAVMSGDQVVGPPKTESSIRTVQIPPQLIPRIEDFFKQWGITEPDAWLFPSVKDRNVPIHPNSLRGYFSRARKTPAVPTCVSTI